MASDRTFVTEVATGLGMLIGGTSLAGASSAGASGDGELGELVATRPTGFVNLGPAEWERLDRLWDDEAYRTDFEQGAANGRAFALAPDALNGRRPRVVEWTGPRRAPGDEVVPADLRVDHVYLVSCKYLSKVLHNSSPQRLVDGLLGHAPLEERGDWYAAVAPRQHAALYAVCASVLPPEQRAPLAELGRDVRRTMAKSLAGEWPDGGAEAYRELCEEVAAATAERWASRITPRNREAVLWRLLRIGSAPYFMLGTSPAGSTRLRIDTPWDWRQRFDLRSLEVEAQPGGQPRVGWRGSYRDRATGEEHLVEGHVELRWSHGRFSGPPEAKVYLDTAPELVPGYHPLEATERETPEREPTEPATTEPGAPLPASEPVVESGPLRLFEG